MFFPIYLVDIVDMDKLHHSALEFEQVRHSSNSLLVHVFRLVVALRHGNAVRKRNSATVQHGHGQVVVHTVALLWHKAALDMVREWLGTETVEQSWVVCRENLRENEKRELFSVLRGKRNSKYGVQEEWLKLLEHRDQLFIVRVGWDRFVHPPVVPNRYVVAQAPEEQGHTDPVRVGRDVDACHEAFKITIVLQQGIPSLVLLEVAVTVFVEQRLGWQCLKKDGEKSSLEPLFRTAKDASQSTLSRFLVRFEKPRT